MNINNPSLLGDNWARNERYGRVQRHYACMYCYVCSRNSDYGQTNVNYGKAHIEYWKANINYWKANINYWEANGQYGKMYGYKRRKYVKMTYKYLLTNIALRDKKNASEIKIRLRYFNIASKVRCNGIKCSAYRK